MKHRHCRSRALQSPIQPFIPHLRTAVSPLQTYTKKHMLNPFSPRKEFTVLLKLQRCIIELILREFCLWNDLAGLFTFSISLNHSEDRLGQNPAMEKGRKQGTAVPSCFPESVSVETWDRLSCSTALTLWWASFGDTPFNNKGAICFHAAAHFSKAS